ncbi:AraC family transcriptional regulator [Clostridium sp. BL-8]|uniref:AraC family transcriptional regulator n=1 Tax=Clostridium sp. BL-8 TaxID=349938 RepID=UPI0009C4A285|nr:AraC family transcriptional regulator [Clostridium sp. BL-8]OOM76002.1 HTH-type transcriptional activator Btr [Clostridium sp. BL-8]
MNIIKNLFFHLHYCNCKQLSGEVKYSSRVNRTLKHHVLILITEGKGYIRTTHESYQLKEGTLLYLCPNVQYSVEVDSVEPVHFFSVHFSYAIVGFDNDKWDITDKVNNFPLDFMQSLKDYYLVDNAFKKLVENWMAKLPNYEFIAKTLFQELLFEIFQNIKNNNNNYSASLKVEKVIEYMINNINNKITLTELSKLVCLSPAYLSRVFKETTGYSVVEFFNKIKVDKAKELIIDGDKKIKEVAKVLGFTDEFYFSRIFKKIEGISPLEFYHKNVHGY